MLAGRVVAVAILLSIVYWIIQALVHARARGEGFLQELLGFDRFLIAERIGFFAVIGTFAVFIIGTLQRARRERERISREADLKRDTIIENIQELILLQDRNLTALWANKAAGDSVGLAPEEIVGKHCYELWHQRSEPCVICPVLEAMETNSPREHDVFTPDGRAFYIRGYPVHDERGAVVGAVEVTLDITTRKKMEDDLAREKERLAVTLASIGDGVIATDTTGAITFVNRAAEKLTGWSRFEALGRGLDELLKLIDERTRMPRETPLDEVRRRGTLTSLPPGTLLIAKDGTERLIADSGAPIRDPNGKIIGAILVFRDVTEKRRLEEEIIKSQKLESLGVLAGGIAHDFNNVLAAIIGNASLARLSISPDDKTYPVLADIEKAALRARKLAQQLLTFAKGGAPVKKVTSLSQIIRDTASFALSGSNVSCVFQLPPDLWQVDADAEQISHAVHNIVINAREAMPRGGEIRVTGENLSEEDSAALPLARRRHVKISIRDTGVGIPRENLGKIFDPYFTTKEERHSGLGLAVAYFVAKKHGGLIVVDSEPEVATTFSIYLPAAGEERPESEEQGRGTALRGQGRILAMDDDQLILDVLGKILERFGYEPAFAKDGAEAIEKYRAAMEAGKPFDAVIMDLTVTGGMGGSEAIELLRLVDPEVAAIVSSGYSDDPVLADYRRYGFVAGIAKPFRADELSEVLAKVLARRAASKRRDRHSV